MHSIGVFKNGFTFILCAWDSLRGGGVEHIHFFSKFRSLKY